MAYQESLHYGFIDLWHYISNIRKQESMLQSFLIKRGLMKSIESCETYTYYDIEVNISIINKVM